MKTFTQKAIEEWNKQADEYNQWNELGEDEKLEWFDKQASHFSEVVENEVSEKCDCKHSGSCRYERVILENDEICRHKEK